MAERSAARDRILRQMLTESFQLHPRLKRFDLAVDVRGQVAHITGSVRRETDAGLVTAAASRLNGILAVWAVLKTPAAPAPVILDIGCGEKKQFPCAIGVDRMPIKGAGVIADLEHGLPFKDNSCHHIFAVHCLEHLQQLIPAMNELHRVLRPHGILHALVPKAGSTNAAADPTHVRFFNRQTFKYFCVARPGIRRFQPLLVTEDGDTVFADLKPVKPPQGKTADMTALFFD